MKTFNNICSKCLNDCKQPDFVELLECKNFSSKVKKKVSVKKGSTKKKKK